MNNALNNKGFSNPKEENPVKRDDTTSLFVSLYLIVLAFFVVMNSISNQEQNKVNAATESVTRAFKNPYEPEADFVDVAASSEAPTPNDEFYDQIQGIFASLVGFDGKFPTSGGSVVKVNFRASDLFETKSDDFRQNQAKFLNQLVSFLQAGRSSDKREIDFVLSTGKKLPKGPTYWEDLNILRAGAFVHKLKQMGVSENQLSIGVVKGREDQVTLTFYMRERKESQQDLKGHETEKLPASSLTEPSSDTSPQQANPEEKRDEI